MKIFSKNKKQEAEAPKTERITSKTIEQYRREVIDSAKRFKYPVQYEKHRLVISAMLVGVVFVIVFFMGVVWRLYLANDTSNFLHKITQVIPFKVGKVDDQAILYSDYLAYYRSSWHYHLNKDISAQSDPTEESERQISEKYSKEALLNAARVALVKKIAQQKGLTVEQEEIETELKAKLVYDGKKISTEAFGSIIKDYYGLDRTEYRQIFLRYPLLMRKVVLEVDDYAKESVKLTQEAIKKSAKPVDLPAIAKSLEGRKVYFLDSGVVNIKANHNELLEMALSRQPGEISDPFVSYNLKDCNILRLVSKDEETIHYQVIRIPLSEFSDQFDKIIKDKKITNYIKIKLDEQ